MLHAVRLGDLVSTQSTLNFDELCGAVVGEIPLDPSFVSYMVQMQIDDDLSASAAGTTFWPSSGSTKPAPMNTAEPPIYKSL